MSIRKLYVYLAGCLMAVGALPAAWGVGAPSPCFPPTTTCYTVQSTGIGTGGTLLAAQAIFQVSGGNLYVTLSNISMDDVFDPPDVLTALGFTLMNGSTLLNLTTVSALITNGSDVYYDPQGQPAGDVVGGEWAYASGINFQGAQQGISSTGLGIFGQANFPGSDLEAPTAVDGLQYGILSKGDNTATGNAGVTGSGGMIKDTVQFKFAGVPAGFALNTPGALSNVVFQYGTSLSEPFLKTAPAPGTATLLGLGVLGLLLMRRRKIA
jgi:hypothetical protein